MGLAGLADALTWNTAWTVAVSAYALAIAIFLILENRSPQSTFAWLFLLLLFPFGGLVIYMMVGRNRHAFSRKHVIARLLEGTTLAERSAAIVAEQSSRLLALEQSHGEYARLAGMLWASARAPLTLGNRVEILQDAEEKYPRLLADIRSATESVHLLYYEWSSDRFTGEVAALLAEKAAQGIAVRVLYDPVGSFWMLRSAYVRDLRRKGVHMFPFSPLYRLHTLGYRNHRKVAVVDGVVGYSGGLNMTETHLTGPPGFRGWRDTHTRVTGEAVGMLQSVFATMWHNTTGENLFDERHFPPFPTPPADAGGAPLQVVAAGPDSRWEAIRHSYLAMIGLAQHHVYLQSPFLILDTSVAEAMKTAALAGVDVRVMIAPRGAEFSPAYRAGATYAADMARAGVQVLLYGGPYFHAKTICVDSEVCSIGSANIDIGSFSINYETNLVVHDPGVTRELEADFLEDQEHCTRFSVAEYHARPVGSRFADSAARLCSPLL